MTARSPDCDDRRLFVLLDGDDQSGESLAAAEHLGRCGYCQARLMELSADNSHWADQRQLLQPIDGDVSETGTIVRMRCELGNPWQRPTLDEATVRSLLSAPSHPEMLGRMGRYEIERMIGHGGMGIVLKGFDSELNRPVAVKVLAPHLARVGAARQRFAREARAAAAVVHEHVVPIHNVESEQAHPYLVMQFIPGESLQTRVDREGPLSVMEILRIGRQAASGLAAAHAQGLIHRDVKPGNILLESGVDRAYLTDFGLARTTDDASLTYTGVVAGTPHYMSPEQADGRPLDPRSDLFSLGSVLYFMATGHPPFRADRPMAVLKRTCHDPHRPVRQSNAEIPDELAQIIDRLLAKDPARRIESATVLEQKLAELLSAAQSGRLRLRPARSHFVPLILIGTAALVATAVRALVPPSPVAGRPGESGSAASVPTAPPREQLETLDVSPTAEAQLELGELHELLNSLESTPFPEVEQTGEPQ